MPNVFFLLLYILNVKDKSTSENCAIYPLANKHVYSDPTIFHGNLYFERAVYFSIPLSLSVALFDYTYFWQEKP